MMYRFLHGLAALGCALPAAAQERGIVNASAAPELFSAGYLAQVLGSLLVVFICLFAVIYLLRRVNRVGGGSNAALRVIGSASVGQREKVVLIEAGKEQLLLGVAQGSVRTLHVFSEPVIDAAALAQDAPDFASGAARRQSARRPRMKAPARHCSLRWSCWRCPRARWRRRRFPWFRCSRAAPAAATTP
jgi:flagellar protein FliO/FliZ